MQNSNVELRLPFLGVLALKLSYSQPCISTSTLGLAIPFATLGKWRAASTWKNLRLNDDNPHVQLLNINLQAAHAYQHFMPRKPVDESAVGASTGSSIEHLQNGKLVSGVKHR